MNANLRSALVRRLAAALEREVVIAREKEVEGGCINGAKRIELEDGSRFFVKSRPDAPEGFFEAEIEGLEALEKTGVIRSPRVIGSGGGVGSDDPGSPPFLILEWIESAAPASDHFSKLGNALAALHRTTADQFGFESDNYIGATPQVNPWKASWPEFFVEARIGFMLKLLERKGYATAELRAGADKLLARIDDLLGGREIRPSLIHGDLWSGNIMSDESGAPVLIDPAVHYADREADIAMTELFGRFAPEFYGAYKESFPLDDGYEERRDIYNLYHLMNHLYLFGLSYMPGVMGVLRRFK